MALIDATACNLSFSIFVVTASSSSQTAASWWIAAVSTRVQTRERTDAHSFLACVIDAACTSAHDAVSLWRLLIKWSELVDARRNRFRPIVPLSVGVPLDLRRRHHAVDGRTGALPVHFFYSVTFQSNRYWVKLCQYFRISPAEFVQAPGPPCGIGKLVRLLFVAADICHVFFYS